MKNLSKRRGSLAFLLLTLITAGCDIVEKDVHPKDQHVDIQMVASPNKAVVILAHL